MVSSRCPSRANALNGDLISLSNFAAMRQMRIYDGIRHKIRLEHVAPAEQGNCVVEFVAATDMLPRWGNSYNDYCNGLSKFCRDAANRDLPMDSSLDSSRKCCSYGARKFFGGIRRCYRHVAPNGPKDLQPFGQVPDAK